ncbi:unnamed protein product, partial [Owenia fusiformis]
MFAVFSKAIDYVFKRDENKDEENDNELHVSCSRQTRHFDGVITGIHSGYGLINGEIYFSFDTIIGQTHRPKVGEHVTVSAYRDGQESGWKATTVSIYGEDWDDTSEELPKDSYSKSSDGTSVDTTNFGEGINPEPEVDQIKKDTVVGTITDINQGSYLINKLYAFDQCDIIVDGYIPYRGDWVRADIEHNQTKGEIKIQNVSPNRTQNFEGVVNAVLQGFGFVNKDIYFTFAALEEGAKTPRVGDRVHCVAIESEQRNCQWRAIKLSLETTVDPGQVLRSQPGLFRHIQPGRFSKQLQENKQGIVISDNLNMGELRLGQQRTTVLRISNTSSVCHTLLKCAPKKQTDCQFEVKSYCLVAKGGAKEMLEDQNASVALHPGSNLLVNIICTANNLGADKQLLMAEFEGFKIGRNMSVDVTGVGQQAIGPTNPYVRKQTFGRYKTSAETQGDTWLVPGEKIQRSKMNLKMSNKLPQYPVPREVRECVLEDKDLIAIIPPLGEELCLENYVEKLSTLLYLEEIQEEVDIRTYDMERVCLEMYGGYLKLQVGTGLAEGRPSVLVGDSVILSVPEDGYMNETHPEYEGIVHEMFSDSVLLKFNETFHTKYMGEDYNVRFVFKRTPIRRCHRAVRQAPSLGKEVIFPDDLVPKMSQLTQGRRKGVSPVKPIRTPTKTTNTGKLEAKARHELEREHMELVNKQLNDRQRSAVWRILNGHCRPTPYILFGPPGTGKTVTLVESILQVFHNVPSSRIIACAPSNSAADLITERLHESGHIKTGEMMVRLIAFSRNIEDCPECVQPYCMTGGDEIESVSRHRLIITTCSSTGSLYNLGLRVGHFTHCFIDEAGQATEPEVLVAVGLVATHPEGQIVLAGDPMQLGPVLRSNLAKTYGLEISLLERLIERPLYARNEVKFSDHGSYDPLLVTKLVQNYRSHSILLKLPSETFYFDELVPCADPSLVNQLTHFELLPNRVDCPLIFHGVRGSDMREESSPSWFNPQEALQVVKYLKALVSNDEYSLSYSDIGVITPYRKQVEKIRVLMEQLGLEKVKVGSVEEFQGQERLVMIVSTVRSNEQMLGYDYKFNLGFLSNPKRFNVAITRAHALLVIIGNPHVLCQDEYWEALLRYCIQNKAYTGCDLPNIEGVHDEDLPEDEKITLIASDKSLKAVETSFSAKKDSSEAINTSTSANESSHRTSDISQDKEMNTPHTTTVEGDSFKSVGSSPKFNDNLAKNVTFPDVQSQFELQGSTINEPSANVNQNNQISNHRLESVIESDDYEEDIYTSGDNAEAKMAINDADPNIHGNSDREIEIPENHVANQQTTAHSTEYIDDMNIKGVTNYETHELLNNEKGPNINATDLINPNEHEHQQDNQYIENNLNQRQYNQDMINDVISEVMQEEMLKSDQMQEDQQLIQNKQMIQNIINDELAQLKGEVHHPGIKMEYVGDDFGENGDYYDETEKTRPSLEHNGVSATANEPDVITLDETLDDNNDEVIILDDSVTDDDIIEVKNNISDPITIDDDSTNVIECVDITNDNSIIDITTPVVRKKDTYFDQGTANINALSETNPHNVCLNSTDQFELDLAKAMSLSLQAVEDAPGSGSAMYTESADPANGATGSKQEISQREETGSHRSNVVTEFRKMTLGKRFSTSHRSPVKQDLETDQSLIFETSPKPKVNVASHFKNLFKKENPRNIRKDLENEEVRHNDAIASVCATVKSGPSVSSKIATKVYGSKYEFANRDYRYKHLWEQENVKIKVVNNIKTEPSETVKSEIIEPVEDGKCKTEEDSKNEDVDINVQEEREDDSNLYRVMEKLNITNAAAEITISNSTHGNHPVTETKVVKNETVEETAKLEVESNDDTNDKAKAETDNTKAKAETDNPKSETDNPRSETD